jgi:hypothetical protein
VAVETRHLVQVFVAQGRGLRAEAPVACRSAEAARLKAETLVGRAAGVIAFSVTADVDLGEYDQEPVVLFRAGRMPPAFDDQ